LGLWRWMGDRGLLRRLPWRSNICTCMCMVSCNVFFLWALVEYGGCGMIS
jgi:hypothetical protein